MSADNRRMSVHHFIFTLARNVYTAMPTQAYLEICLVLADGVARGTGGDIYMGMLCRYAAMSMHADMTWAYAVCPCVPWNPSVYTCPTCMHTAQAPAMMSLD